MAAAPENAAIQTVTPNRLRGQMTFLFLFIMNVIGMGLGPMLVGALNQYAFGEDQIRHSLAAVGALMGVPAIYVFWRGLHPYGRAIALGKPLDQPWMPLARGDCPARLDAAHARRERRRARSGVPSHTHITLGGETGS